MNGDRIAVVGISASGKSSFARKLAERTGLPLFHGDQLEWLADWCARPGPDIEALHCSWIDQPRWIIEGWIDAGQVARLNRADVVVDLDFSALLCTWRLFQRMLRGIRRDEMPAGCVDKFSWKYLGVVFRRQERLAIESALAAATVKKYVRMTSPLEAAAWLQGL